MKPYLAKCAYAVVLLAAVSYAFITLRGSQGIPALMQKREEIRQLEKRNAELARENELKRQKIQRLRDNPSEQELEIRQRLKMVKPGEKVFILQDPAK